MDVGRLRKIDDTRWTVPLASHETRAPVILFGTESLLSTMDDKVLEQILNTSRLPGIVGPAVTMPDAHWGYGFPIGGVAAFDADEGGVISAGGVGFDISCGIRSLRTPLTSKQIEPVIGELSEALFRAIPAGVGEPGHHPVTLKELDQIMKGGGRLGGQEWIRNGVRPLPERRERDDGRRESIGGVGQSQGTAAKRDGNARLGQSLFGNPGRGTP